jgi:hypothetical protein
LASAARAALAAVTVDLRPELERQAVEGFALGFRHAAAEVVEPDDLEGEVGDDGLLDDEPESEPERERGLSPVRRRDRPREPESRPDRSPAVRDPRVPDVDWDDLAEVDDELGEVIDGADDRARDRLDEAIRLTDTLPMSTQGDVDLVTRQAAAAVNGARRDAAWVAGRSQSIGVAAAAEAADAGGLLWITERDGCLGCLSLSGQVAFGGAPFDGEGYGDRSFLPVPYPPLHPHCRCRVRPYLGDPPTRDLSATDPASVLAREARRSVLRGWSAYDSKAARLRAAEDLLDDGADLPKSVQDRARRNLAAGDFERDGGKVPDGQVRMRPAAIPSTPRARKATAASAPATPPAPAPAASRLARAAASGERSRDVIVAGNSGARVERVAFNDGTVAIRKKLAPFDDLTAERQATAELVAPRIGRALGLPVPEVHRLAADEILMEHLPGTVAAAHPTFDFGSFWESPDGARMSLADLIMGNSDRHGGNFLVDDEGQLSGLIDHALAFDWRGVDPSDPIDLFTPTPADITRLRGRVEALRGDFDAAGAPPEWWVNVIARIDAITAHGSKDIVP